MKRSYMAVFFLVVFTVYFITNLYLFIKGLRQFPEGNMRIIYIISFVVIASSFIVAKFLERSYSGPLTDVLNFIGGLWLGLMLYGTVALLLTDIARPLLKITGLLSGDSLIQYNIWAFRVVMILTFLFIAGGMINSFIPVTRKYEITINKDAGSVKNLRIAAVSDIHLGSVIGKGAMKKLSGMLREIKPDVVFLLGDIVDGEIEPVIRKDLLKYLDCPKCREDLLAITGNHEFIGGASKTIPYIEKHGIRILKDEVVTIAGSVQVIGRIDRDGARFKGGKRASLDSLVSLTDRNKPIILLDHQPFHLSETEAAGIDLQLSGHTHNGQMWPLNHITDAIYELGYGYLKKGETHFIVSSGYGLWGPRIRSGSRPEVLQIDISFIGNR